MWKYRRAIDAPRVTYEVDVLDRNGFEVRWKRGSHEHCVNTSHHSSLARKCDTTVQKKA